MNQRILIIEDNDLLGEVLQRKLVSMGYEVLWSRDGARGFQMLEEEKPSLLLLDIALPSMNGYEILAEKSKNPALENIPVIVISNSGQPISYEDLKKYGVKEYIVKANIEPGEVAEKVVACFTAPTGGPTQPVEKTSLLKDKKILWVEDDPFLAEIAGKKLVIEKADLRRAIDSESTWKILDEWKPDIIMLDVMLPGITGIDILEKLKSTPATKDIPVIMLSNVSQDENVSRAMSFGAKKFLTKATLTPSGIIKEIEMALN